MTLDPGYFAYSCGRHLYAGAGRLHRRYDKPLPRHLERGTSTRAAGIECTRLVVRSNAVSGAHPWIVHGRRFDCDVRREILAGKHGISAETGLHLSRFFGTSEGLWTGIQDDPDRAVTKNVPDTLSRWRKYSSCLSPIRQRGHDSQGSYRIDILISAHVCCAPSRLSKPLAKIHSEERKSVTTLTLGCPTMS